MWGADPESLEHLAAQIKAAHDVLARVDADVTGRIHTIRWPGPDGDRFRSDWGARLRPALVRAEGFLDEGGRTLRANAEQQRQASGGQGVGASPAGAAAAVAGAAGGAATLQRLGDLGSAWNKSTHKRIFTAAKAVTGGASGAAHFLGNKKMVVGRYTDSWRRVMDTARAHGVPAQMLKFKSWSLLHRVQPVAAALDGPLALAKGGFAKVAPGLNFLTVAGDANDLGAAFGREGRLGPETWRASVNTLSDGLMAVPGPTGLLLGANVKMWDGVGQAAAKIDWSPKGMHDTLDGFGHPSWNLVKDIAQSEYQGFSRLIAGKPL